MATDRYLQKQRLTPKSSNCEPIFMYCANVVNHLLVTYLYLHIRYWHWLQLVVWGVMTFSVLADLVPMPTMACTITRSWIQRDIWNLELWNLPDVQMLFGQYVDTCLFTVGNIYPVQNWYASGGFRISRRGRPPNFQYGYNSKNLYFEMK